MDHGCKRDAIGDRTRGINAVPNDDEVISLGTLIKRRFLRNKLAIVSGIVIIILYLGAIFAEFVAPHGLNVDHPEYAYMPPQRLRFVDAEGNFHWRPFVYDMKKGYDEETWELIYTEDTSKMHPLRLFVRGDRYKLWGLWESDLHLFGVEGGYFFPLGTDRFGRDQLTNVIYGSRVSLTIGLLGVIMSITIGSIMGAISGYYGGWVDMVIQRVIELLRSFPRLPLWMALSAAIPLTWSPLKVYFGIVTLLAFIDWTGLAREVRAKVLSYREEAYVLASKSLGASDAWTILTHVIPNTASHILVVGTLALPGMILGESTLSFLGLGIQPPMTSWGVLLQEAQNVQTLQTYPWLLIPGLFIMITVLAFNFLGDGVRDAIDPYSD